MVAIAGRLGWSAAGLALLSRGFRSPKVLVDAHRVADRVRDLLSRLEVMALMAGMDLPMTAIRDQVSRAVDLIIQQTRLHDGSRKITAITEVLGMVDGQPELQDIFTFNYKTGKLVPTGTIPVFLERLAQRGVEVDKAVFKK